MAGLCWNMVRILFMAKNEKSAVCTINRNIIYYLLKPITHMKTYLLFIMSAVILCSCNNQSKQL
jgi:hypothetical protein